MEQKDTENNKELYILCTPFKYLFIYLFLVFDVFKNKPLETTKEGIFSLNYRVGEEMSP